MIVIDWSDLKPGKSWCLLRGAVPIGGRTLALTGSGSLPTQISGYSLNFRQGFLDISTNTWLRVLCHGQTSTHRPSRHPAAHRAAREQPLALLSG
ncbi:hypothetical protein [Xanthomonas citri]|uniref:hypothetical protein n=1 Tax=Xanthomonas citri TaxID=346 RepID=UPI00156295EC|nr:hypothetical protein [Xanthomonas citri]